MDSQIKQLMELYQYTSKHSGYQMLPPVLQKIIPAEAFQTGSHYEKERMEYINKYVNFHNASFCDIGCNCGYFSFEAVRAGSKNGDLYEGDPKRAEFVKIASELCGNEYAGKLLIVNEYFSFTKRENKKCDITFLLNVLHHVGDDYGSAQTIIEAKRSILNQLKAISDWSRILIFQLGFNWMGDKERCLFEHGEKKEMISWLRKNLNDCWEIHSVGIPQMVDGKIEYRDQCFNNIERMDALGEFLNRPLFIMKSKALPGGNAFLKRIESK